MAIDLFDLFNRFCSDVNTFQGGFVRPERDFERIVNTVNQDIWNDFTSQAEKTQEIIDNLTPFFKSVNIIVKPGAGNYGVAKYPGNYGRYSASRTIIHKETCLCDTEKDTYDDGECSKKGSEETEIEKQERIEKYKDGIVEARVDKIESSRWASYLDHKTKCPTIESPGCSQFDTGFKIAPRQVSVIVLDYYVQPKYAKFAYTKAPGNPQVGTGDYIIYNEAQSGKLEWTSNMIPFFIKKLGEAYAKYTRDGALFQMTK